MCEYYVVKLGGSLITEKSKPYTLRSQALDEAVGAVAEAYSRGRRIVLVHGGGSFGHYEVDRIVREKGILYATDAARVQHAMLKLAKEVIGRLLAAGVPASLHPPHTLCSSWPGECFLQPIMRDLSLGLVPVTYGDAIPGHNDDVIIVSGDDLALSIATYLGRETCIIYVIDKAGIIGRDGRVLSEVSPRSELMKVESGGFDVTGGIEKKLSTAFEAARRGLRVVVTSVEGMRRIIVEGKPLRGAGTLVKA